MDEPHFMLNHDPLKPIITLAQLEHLVKQLDHQSDTYWFPVNPATLRFIADVYASAELNRKARRAKNKRAKKK